ncbi:hypothetical protein BXZ70DRAFT_439898 [Cristinia sonorae]|uniref:Uncharacterized protein n=1 Tax=Cristinia sonorae TaxID=1940300 RepID=A0A8K0XMB2_9AGAR|nr:hypothetical protein BXZ70DRAFT_439898 [Cristinia sonorae]
MLISDLPQELLDLIIDYVAELKDWYGPVRSLRSCSYVARAWWPRCRAHLHHTFECLEGMTARKSAFIDDPSLCDLVRTLIVKLNGNHTWIKSNARRVGPEDVMVMLKRMRGITHLSITSLALFRRETQEYEWLLEPVYFSRVVTLHPLVHLTLRNVAFRRFDEFTEIIGRFPVLEELVLVAIRPSYNSILDKTAYSTENSLAPPAKLKSLWFEPDAPSSVDFAEALGLWIKASRETVKIETVTFDVQAIDVLCNRRSNATGLEANGCILAHFAASGYLRTIRLYIGSAPQGLGERAHVLDRCLESGSFASLQGLHLLAVRSDSQEIIELMPQLSKRLGGRITVGGGKDWL